MYKRQVAARWGDGGDGENGGGDGDAAAAPEELVARGGGARRPDVTLARGDFASDSPAVARAWAGADVVFANSTAFDAPALRALARACRARCAPGAVVVTLTSALDFDAGGGAEADGGVRLELVEEVELPMSWGAATAFVHVAAAEAAAACEPAAEVDGARGA